MGTALPDLRPCSTGGRFRSRILIELEEKTFAALDLDCVGCSNQADDSTPQVSSRAAARPRSSTVTGLSFVPLGRDRFF
jgi:hypothetical protein